MEPDLTGRDPLDLFGTYDNLHRDITAAMPDAQDLLDMLAADPLVDAVGRYMHAVLGRPDATTDPLQIGRGRIVNQATNDYLDLLYESLTGRGRPALRTARTLFEHLVNYRWIEANPVEAERYRDHGAIGDLLDLDLNTPAEEEFTGDTRKRVRHWRRRLERRIRPAANRALTKWDKDFRRSWSTATLWKRADQVGLLGEYDTYYRLLSAVIHGSAGGDVGHRARIQGRSVVRTGPAVSACPLALRCGHRYYSMLLTDSEGAAGAAATAKLRALLSTVDGVLAQHRDACIAVDLELWPDEPPAMLMLLKVEPDGSRAWLMLDTANNRTILARPVDMSRDERVWLQKRIRQDEEANPGRTQALIVYAYGLHGSPNPSAEWTRAVDTLGEPRNARLLHVKVPVHDPSLYGPP